MCLQRKQDVTNKCVVAGQFGSWLRARSKRNDWRGAKGGGNGKEGDDRRKLLRLTREGELWKEDSGVL